MEDRKFDRYGFSNLDPIVVPAQLGYGMAIEIEGKKGELDLLIVPVVAWIARPYIHKDKTGESAGVFQALPVCLFDDTMDASYYAIRDPDGIFHWEEASGNREQCLAYFEDLRNRRRLRSEKAKA